jgi:hypothetical protein
MRRKHAGQDDDYLPVMVPRSDKRLIPTAPERVARLREHLQRELLDLGKAKRLDRLASAVSPEPAGFVAAVAHTACALCEGWCCRNGSDDAFLDDRTLARHRFSDPLMTDQDILGLYLSRVPKETFQGSCIFHGKHGCTLDRSMRADVCNTYFCGGLQAFIAEPDHAQPAKVFAGEGKTMRESSLLRTAK